MIEKSNATAGDEVGAFGIQRAATLLRQTTQQARRQFEPSAPWFLAPRAVLVLIAYGAVWLSVREQHPYGHLTAVALLGVAVFVVVNLGATLLLARRAYAGARLPSRRWAGSLYSWSWGC